MRKAIVATVIGIILLAVAVIYSQNSESEQYPSVKVSVNVVEPLITPWPTPTPTHSIVPTLPPGVPTDPGHGPTRVTPK